ncbi:MAG: transposase [Mediterraneibacter gnavus]
MLRRYELTDSEWNRIVELLPLENTGKQGCPRKDNRTILGCRFVRTLFRCFHCSGTPAQCRCKKGAPTEIGHSRGGASTKIHAVVDAYGNPVHLMISEGQRNDIVYAIPLLEQVKIPEDSQILADRGYDSDQLIDYIYSRGAEPTVRRKTL